MNEKLKPTMVMMVFLVGITIFFMGYIISTENVPIIEHNDSTIASTSITKVKVIAMMDGWQIVIPNYPAEVSAIIQTCQHKCEVIAQTSKASHFKADLVWFHMYGLPRTPLYKYENQVWILSNGESPYIIANDLRPYDGLFNYTMTFYPNSTILTQQAYVYKLDHIKSDNMSYAEKRRRAAGRDIALNGLWYVSNCDWVHSGRMEYVNELSKYLNVDVFSRHVPQCKKKMKHVNVHSSSEPRNAPCDLCEHTFYLSFENALCKHYISEKLWVPFLSDSLAIPIVMGGYSIEDYTAIAPPNSFIHVSNFTSPKHLAEHLAFVVKDDEAFNYYHRWRDQFGVRARTNEEYRQLYCRMCELAHERPPQVINKLDSIMSTKDCRDLSSKESARTFYNIRNRAASLFAGITTLHLNLACMFLLVTVAFQ